MNSKTVPKKLLIQRIYSCCISIYLLLLLRNCVSLFRHKDLSCECVLCVCVVIVSKRLFILEEDNNQFGCEAVHPFLTIYFIVYIWHLVLGMSYIINTWNGYFLKQLIIFLTTSSCFWIFDTLIKIIQLLIRSFATSLHYI